MSIKNLYPTTFPVSSIDFVNGDKISSAFSFTRNSIGTYIDENGFIKTADIGKPRITYDLETGKKLGLLIEEARTNEFTNSNPWSGGTGVTWVSGQTSPTGGTEAYKMQEDTTTDIHGLPISTGGFTGNYNRTFSVFAKAAGNRYLSFWGQLGAYPGTDAPECIFDLQDGIVAQNTDAGSAGLFTSGSGASIQDFGNGWYRCSVHVNPFSLANRTIYLLMGNSAANDSMSFAGNGSNGILLFGLQKEIGSFPTSYIPTSGSAVTRAADIATILAPNFQSGKIYFKSDLNNTENIKIKSTTITPEYNLVVSKNNNLPYLYTSINNIKQSYISLDNFPTSQTDTTKISFNFYKDTGTIDLSTNASDDDTASVVSIPYGRSFSSAALDTIELSNGTFESINLWDENLNVAKLSSISNEFSSTNKPISVSSFVNPSSLSLGTSSLPTLDLNFARNKSLIDDTTNQNLITFTRSSTATYVDSNGIIQTAAADEPRFDHDPETGESLGLLIEESRTNVYNYSEEFTDASWEKNEVILTPNSDLAPDGTFTATKISATTVSTDEHKLVHTASAGSAVQSTWSVYAKAGENTKIGLRRNASDGFDLGQVDLITGALLRAVPGYTTTTQNVGNGWWKISLSFSQTAAAYLRPCICPIPDSLPVTADADTPYSDDGTSGFYIWGAQLEEGSFPTSYIPTSGSTVTRAADVASIEGINFSSWYNQSEGTIFTQAKMSWELSKPSTFPDIYTSDAFPDRLWSLFILGGINYLIVGADTHSRTLEQFSTSPQSFKVAQALSNNDLSYSVSKDGNTVLTGALNKTITNTEFIRLGYQQSGFKHISRFTYYPKRLTDTELQSLTDPAIATWNLVFDSSLSSDGVCGIVTNSPCTYEVDWGDGSSTETVNASGTFSALHTYIIPEKYTVKISVISGVFRPYYVNSFYAGQLIEIGPSPDGWTNTSTSGFGGSLQSAWYSNYQPNNLEFIDKGLNTSGIINFHNTWFGCSKLTSFPLLDTSSGTDFSYAWRFCTGLTRFPDLNTSSSTSLYTAWDGCYNLQSFPFIDTSSVTSFGFAWRRLENITRFPLLDTSSGIDFSYAWMNCNSLTDFPANMFNTTGTLLSNAFSNAFTNCALSSQSTENILTSLDANGQSGITLSINSGTNTSNYDWTAPTWDSFNNLVSKSWTISYNDNLFSSSPLDLQFAATKTLDSRITFSRVSTGTYVDSNGIIQTAALDTARFDHDPDTLESLGLLVEEARTNLATESVPTTFSSSSNFVWRYIGGTSSGNAALSPDNTLTAAEFTHDGSSIDVRQYIPQVNNLSAGTTYVGSIFLKSINATTFSISKTGASDISGTTGTFGAVFDLSAGTASSSGTDVWIESYSNGWYKCSFAFVANTTNAWASIIIYPGTGYNFYFWGGQIEVGSFPTSYIPTSGSTVTRAAEIANITGSNFTSWHNQSEGTYYSQASKIYTNPNLQNTVLTTHGSTRYPEFSFRPANEVSPGVGSIYSTILTVKSPVPLDSAKFAGAYEDGVGVTSIINNTYQGTVTADPITLARSYIEIGHYSNGYQLNGHISRLTYWPKRLPDGALEYITS